MVNIVNKQASRKMYRNTFINVLIVSIFQAILAAVASTVDGICIGNFVGTEKAMAAYGIATTGTILVLIFNAFLSIGTQVIYTQKLSKGVGEKANQILMNMLVLSIAIGIIFVFLGLFANEGLAYIFGARGIEHEELKQWAADYIKYFYIGAPFLFTESILFSVVYLDGDRLLAILSVVLSIANNVIGDIVSTKILNFGMSGVACATSISAVVGMVVLFLHFFKKGSSSKLRIYKFDFKEMKNCFIAGMPVASKYLMIFGRSVLIEYILLWIGGEDAASAYGIVLNVSNIIDAVAIGCLTATLILSGVYYGEENEDALNHLLYMIYKMVLYVMLALTVFVFFMSPVFLDLYSSNLSESARDLSLFALRLNAFTVPFATITSSFVAYFQGCKMPKQSMIATLLNSFVFPLVCVLVFGVIFHAKGLFIGFLLGYCLYPIVYFSFLFIKNKKVPRTARETFLFDKDFGYKEEDTIEFSINGINDALSVSKPVLEFCERHNIDKRRANHLSACVEEMANLIVLSGFSRSKRNKHCSLRILYKNNKLVLRVRDDCEKFNIKDKVDRYHQKDETINFAIRIVLNLSNSVEYSHILKTNNLIITI